MSGVLDLRVGSRLWFDGGAWSVCEVSGAEVRLRDSREGYRLAAINELLGRARDLDAENRDVENPTDGLSSLALSALTSKQRSALERRLAVITPLMEPGGSDSAALIAAASTLGISTRTVRRQLDALRRLGLRYSLKRVPSERNDIRLYC